ncbi:GNAT family N-acetyltransferase [Prolixibacteraceae bacterium JC049]|nr:GNAT family N-acetyltransferase [Prolixibacteraceae bacterium JC049]
MKIIEVVDKSTKKLFHKVPQLIYKNDSNWIAPLEVTVDEAFDPNKNSFLKKGEIIRWVLVDEKSTPIGRIGAFFHKEKAHAADQPTGGCGYFECIDNQDAANLLFDTAREWLKSKGMEAMDGPVNPGENYVNWGLLVKGFMPQGYGMPYNAEYYLSLFENYGFKNYFDQYSYHLDLTKPFPARFWKIAEWIAKKPDYSFEHFSFKNQEKFVQDFVKIYDKAWKRHGHFNELDPQEVRDFMNGAKMILEEEYIWFAYHKGEPIALFGMVPDVNQVFQKMNGKLTPLNILKLLWYRKSKVITRARILIMGIVPEFQKSGIESAIFWHMDKKMAKRKHVTELELSWAGDFNPKIISLYKSVGGVHTKTHYTMRYLFDREKPFKRATVIE